jgi:hypothetical protein
LLPEIAPEANILPQEFVTATPVNVLLVQHSATPSDHFL